MRRKPEQSQKEQRREKNIVLCSLILCLEIDFVQGTCCDVLRSIKLNLEILLHDTSKYLLSYFYYKKIVGRVGRLTRRRSWGVIGPSGQQLLLQLRRLQ